MPAIKRYTTTLLLAVGLVFLSVISLFLGVIDLDVPSLLSGNWDQWEIFFLSRLPRLLAILCTGVGMSVAGLIMQQLCMNKFVSPTTGATISSAKFGILLALLFMAPTPPCGAGPSSPLYWPPWAPGSSCGLSSGSSLRTW